ncbi:DUF2087 domain-containing protein [Beduini massiliensis]|uniref:DUF2087 domain-containing protein n=1 Tax=Beduini massiliensis TaxID=1585974 RepID=UPI00059AB5FD|nr:DUF2087 domain-containing protein [Beduini massiliensis]
MNIKDLTLEQLENGYIENQHSYQCIHCDFKTIKGEIYPYEHHFYDAKKRMAIHLQHEHHGCLFPLLDAPKKVNTLTDNQKQIITHLYQHKSDRDIAKLMGISEATVRYQRFSLKEKANQAKVFLAMYHLLESENTIDTFLDIHEEATMMDERYVATKEDEQKVHQDFFISLDPLKLKNLPRKEKYKIIVFKTIYDQFISGKEYSETEVNDILKEIFDDYVTIRRYMIEYGFLKRRDDGSVYMKS